jgi:ABC-type antimicrobial peptide transport system permease subunit
VIAYSVLQRRREIGVRMALGASRSSVLRLVVGQGSRLALVGIALGFAGALSVVRLLRTMLFGVTVTDPPTFGIVALVLAAAALLASFVPAQRACRLDPLKTLREE